MFFAFEQRDSKKDDVFAFRICQPRTTIESKGLLQQFAFALLARSNVMMLIINELVELKVFPVSFVHYYVIYIFKNFPNTSSHFWCRN
jgi:hypothetical protein